MGDHLDAAGERGGVTTGLLVVAAVVLLLWGWWELRSAQPLLTNLTSAVFAFAMFAMSLVLPQILQLPAATGYGLGQSMLTTGLAYVAMPALIMAAVPTSETAAANSLNTLMRAIGTSVSSAVAGVILAHLTISFGPATLPSQDGFRLIMGLGAGAALLAFVVAAFIPGSAKHGR